jgi:hypothetical protein
MFISLRDSPFHVEGWGVEGKRRNRKENIRREKGGEQERKINLRRESEGKGLMELN